MGSAKRQVDLTDEEVTLLVRVLRKHLNTVPSYLLSMQDEVRVLKALLEKLD